MSIFADRMGGLLSFLFPSYDLSPSQVEYEVKKRVAKDHDLKPEDLDIPINYANLPVIEHEQKVDGKYVPVRGKIQGLFDPKIGVVMDAWMRIRSYFSRDALREYTFAFAHEMEHAADYLTGKLDIAKKDMGDYLRNYREDKDEIRANAGAKKVVDSLLGHLYFLAVPQVVKY